MKILLIIIFAILFFNAVVVFLVLSVKDGIDDPHLGRPFWGKSNDT